MTTIALIAIYLGILNGFLFCLLVTFIFDYMCILIIKQNKNPLSIPRCIAISAIVVKQRQTTFACVGSLMCSFWKKSDCSLSGRGANYVQLSLGQTVDGSLISQMANGGKNEAVA